MNEIIVKVTLTLKITGEKIVGYTSIYDKDKLEFYTGLLIETPSSGLSNYIYKDKELILPILYKVGEISVVEIDFID